MYKIEFLRDKCLGCGACTLCDNWEFADDGKVKPKQNELSDIGCNDQAAQVCPVQIIKIVEL
ncbi:ferredoxin [Candidatus Parcubacteria bacterium]|nr:ferredoxin [Candidatus Parcubacteria bacterium]